MMKHVRYTGNLMIKFCAVMMVAFTLLPVIAVPFILKSKIDVPSIIISTFCILFTIIMCLYGRSVNVTMQLYTWYVFNKKNVTIRTLFQKKYQMDYIQCTDVGIGYYIHGVLNSNIGSKVPFIYLSYHKVDSKYKCQMNLLKPTQTCIKLEFRKKTYQYLLNNLPPQQSKMLEKSYVDFQRQ